MALAALLAACSSKPAAPRAVEVVDEVVINNHNALTQDFAHALSQATLLRDDAAVEDLAGAETYEHDVNALVHSLQDAEALAAKTVNEPLPGDKDKAQMFASQMQQQMEAALTGAKELDQDVLAGHDAADALASKAAGVEESIRQAGEAHAGLMNNILRVETVEVAVWEDILPHHDLAANHAKALERIDGMLAHDSAMKDWKAFWTKGAAEIDRRLQAADAVLPAARARIGEAARPAIEGIGRLQASAREKIATLQQELSKAKPSFEKAKASLEDARDELMKAEAAHRKLMKDHDLKPYPMYGSVS